VILKTKEEYVEKVVAFLEHLREDIVIGRLIGRAPEKDTIFVNWETAWWTIRDDIEQKMRDNNTWQGKKCDYLNGGAARRYL
jgi:radical SAM superfamily enzyme